MNRVLSIVITAIFAFSVCGEAAGQNKNFILVIDAGHGGRDAGATHGRYLEKNINLEIALALGTLITKEMPDAQVLYTRKDDRAVGLAARGDFANRAGADLFLSIHTNANPASSPAGSETYVMGADKSEANLEVAKRENEVIRYEEDYTETYAGFDPNSTELSIVFGMMQYANFESSLSFARLIQKQYANQTSLRDRGAKQGPFAVLWRPTMPRVLTEIGFISNDGDRRYIFSENGKQAIVKSLFNAFREYKENFAATTPTAPSPTTPAPATSAPEPTPAPAPEATQEKATAKVPAKLFFVQLAATRARVSTSDRTWGSYRGKVTERTGDGWYKYRIGPYYSQREAENALAKARKNKFPGAFMIEEESANQKR